MECTGYEYEKPEKGTCILWYTSKDTEIGQAYQHHYQMDLEEECIEWYNTQKLNVVVETSLLTEYQFLNIGTCILSYAPDLIAVG